MYFNENRFVVEQLCEIRNATEIERLAVLCGVLIPTLLYDSEAWDWKRKHEIRLNIVKIRSPIGTQ